MRVALVYDRLNKIGGAEAVLTEFARMFPHADWYTSVWDPKKTPFTRGWRVHTSWLNKFPYLRTRHELVPFLMPFAFEAFDFSGYDLVVTIGSAEAKGVITRPGTYHLDYCLTPTRYLYSHAEEYLQNGFMRKIATYLRQWDQVAAKRPDQMIAISEQVKKRIQKYYKRDAVVIYPPVDTKKFSPSSLRSTIYDLPSNYYLTVARLVPYKRIDLLVETFNRMPDRRLVIIGTGSEFSSLKRRAKSNITFMGLVAEDVLIRYYSHCRAFIQMNVEDFGIAMVEAQASGKPVIAYNRGGAAEIVRDKVTGILVKDQKVESFRDAIDALETISISTADCQANARRFDKSTWRKAMQERIIDSCKAR